jgi:hypothetical protein
LKKSTNISFDVDARITRFYVFAPPPQTLNQNGVADGTHRFFDGLRNRSTVDGLAGVHGRMLGALAALRPTSRKHPAG